MGAGGEVRGLAGFAVGQLVDDEVNAQVGRTRSGGRGIGVGYDGARDIVVVSGVVAAVGGNGVALGVAGQELDVGQRHVLLAGGEGTQTRESKDALRGRREGDVLFLVSVLQVGAVSDLGTAFPLTCGDLGLPVGEGGFGGGVTGVLIEGKDAVFVGELVVAQGRIVGGARG